MYRVTFQNQSDILEIYAKKIFQSELWGFVEIEEVVFGERSHLLVDPGEEKIKTMFCGVKRSYIPVTSIIRIDEVEKEECAKIITSTCNNVKAFPNKPPSNRE